MQKPDPKCNLCGHSSKAHKEVQPSTEAALGTVLPEGVTPAALPGLSPGMTLSPEQMCEDCKRDSGPCYPPR